MRKWTLPAVVGIVAIALISYTSIAGDKGDKAGKYKGKDKTAAVSIGQPAPTFALQDQNGQTVNLADHAGKIVVLEWFNEECPYVVRHYEANTMTGLAQKYADKDVVWLAINTTSGKTNQHNKSISDKWNIGFPILNDSTGQVGRQYGAKTTPHMYIINKDGTLAYMGGIDNDPRGNKSDRINYVDKALGELLAGNSVSEPQAKPYGCSIKYAN